MDNVNFGKKILGQLLVMVFIITSCMPSDVPTSTMASQVPGTTGSSCIGGNCAGASDPGLGGGTSLPPTIEIRHLIEPNITTDPSYSNGTGQPNPTGGSYVRKLTIPKNFAGKLYVAGINIGSLADRHVKVRFKFGVDREPVTIPATVSRAPGITPQTDINVLVLDLRNEPFRDLILPYDLFDYNDYPLTPDGKLASDANPVQDNRDSNLYCRGLRVEDDPTFDGVGACNGIQDNSGEPIPEECLYAYAKVLDQGLVKTSGSVRVPLSPSYPQIKSILGSNYLQDFMNYKILKPLPDDIPYTLVGVTRVPDPFVFSELATSNVTDSKAITFSSDWSGKTILGSQYFYRGPYRLIDMQGWQFKFGKLDGPKRLFREGSWVDYDIASGGPLPDDDQNFPIQNKLYFKSYLFPLATKLDLTANVAHMSSAAPDDERSESSLSMAGKSAWMDGSNARANSRNFNYEHIGSCNVSASIEIIARDNNNQEYAIALSKDVKLQLVRPTQYRTDSGNEVLYNNFKSCTTNAGCGGSECCFNNRCWDERLVSQCFDSESTQGNRIIGESCTSDLECSSLCCNRTTGQCAPHNTITTPAVLCSKPIGDSCIAKEWCQKTTVVKCVVVKTGTDNLGNPTCRQQCYNTQEFGDCKNGVCVPPPQAPIPPFDPNDPSACDNAVPAPNF